MMPRELPFEYFGIKMRRAGLFFSLLCILINCFSAASAQVHQKNSVLVLNSYNKGMTWTDNITEGIESVLKGKDRDVDIHYEYMDTKRVFDKKHIENLYELLRHKYRKYKFDVVISADDHALKFLLNYHRNLFPHTPVVFCGVNFLAHYSLTGHDLITGVEEATDIKGTIDVALKLQPKAKQLFVIVDKTASGIANKKALEKVITYFKNRINFSFLEDFDMPGLLKRVQDLPNGSIALLLNYTSDRSGNTFSPAESVALISKHCKVPVYYLWDSDLGYGTVGGKMISGYAQGETAGKMAMRILQGENVSNIPIVNESPNRYMFDYKQLKRFNIESSLLPTGSIIINKPSSFYSENTGLIWSITGITASLLVIILLLSVNIIQRKQAEEELRIHRTHLEELVTERTSQLEEKAEKLDQANIRLQELDHLKSMFIASMSHELRTPLNSIIGFTGIILQGMAGEINPEQRDQLQRVYGSAKHLLALINDVIDISKIEAGKFEVHVEKCSLDGVIKDAVSSLKPEIDNKGLELEISLPQNTQLTTDRKKLLQCILNFLSNAVKFTEKGKVEITAHEVDGMIEIKVKDTGIGMKEEDMPRLFESFVRLDTHSNVTTPGTGLGLYLTRKIVTEQLKGSVSAESTCGEGSTFGIRIPREID